MLWNKWRTGRFINEISIGEKLLITEKIEDKDLLLYLGVTNDLNPLYIHHAYASKTLVKKPVVPAAMLTSIISSAISNQLPGPGSYILEQTLSFPQNVYHQAVIHFVFEVMDVNLLQHCITIKIKAEDEERTEVVNGYLLVSPPHRIDYMSQQVMENF